MTKQGSDAGTLIDGIELATHSKVLIPMGNADSSVEGEEMSLDLNQLITGGRRGFFAYEVSGDSMLDEIKSGYLVFVDTNRKVKENDIIAVRRSDKISVKIFKKRAVKGLFLIAEDGISQTEQDKILGVITAHLAAY